MKQPDIFDKFSTDEGYFGGFRAMGDRYFTLPVIDDIPGTHMDFHGSEQIMWSINNYLGLAGNEDVKREAAIALEKWSTSGPMGARMMSGNTSEHIKLEEQLADFAHKESSILFNYGYLGVIGTIASIVGKDDIILMDKLAHASIIDAAQNAVSNPRNWRPFRHNNMEDLEKQLAYVNRDRKGGVLILTEGVYGMTGDLADLKGLCDLKEKYEARLFIDDAHGTGVMGPTGAGTGEYFGVQDRIDLYFGTFAKAFASIGGFTASSKEAVEWIRYNARTQVFAKSLPMIYVKALQKTLEIIRNGDALRKNLFAIARRLSVGLREMGFYVADVPSPIIPVYVPGGDPATAMGWIKFLRDRGIFITGVMYPVIPKGLVMFRVIPTAAHTDDDVDRTLEAFKAMKDELRLDLGVDDKDIKRIYG